MKFYPVVIGAVLGCLLFLRPVGAQTAAPVTRIDVIAIPETGDPATVAGIPNGVQTTTLSPASPSCNLPARAVDDTTPETTTNPRTVEYEDPFRLGLGRVCRVPIPTLPPGRYRVVARYVADTCNPTGTAALTPCFGARSDPSVPFAVAGVELAPGRPSGGRLGP